MPSAARLCTACSYRLSTYVAGWNRNLRCHTSKLSNYIFKWPYTPGKTIMVAPYTHSQQPSVICSTILWRFTTWIWKWLPKPRSDSSVALRSWVFEKRKPNKEWNELLSRWFSCITSSNMELLGWETMRLEQVLPRQYHYKVGKLNPNLQVEVTLVLHPKHII